jgi:DNA-binding beta-propeller fold protein YncE
MVQFLLSGSRRKVLSAANVACAVCLLLAPGMLAPAWASRRSKEKVSAAAPPDLLLEGGRKLSYERSFHSEREVRPQRGFWRRALDVIAGEPDFHVMVRPYSVATDSRGRIIVTDPGSAGVHVFDFAEQKYKFIWRGDKRKDPMLSPQCVAVDDHDNIYVTDSDSGKIFVFDPNGKYQRAIGSLKGGEGYFKRPTGIAVDSASHHIYVTDTLRNKIFMLDMQGNILQQIGRNGTGDGEFNFPTELRLSGDDLIVVDAMNFRIQVFDRSGAFRFAIGQIGDGTGAMFRPKGVAVDSEGDLYVVDGLWGIVQVFNRQADLLYYFGHRGSALGQFQLPAGLFIDHEDRVFVVDSLNRRVQVFHYFGLPKRAKEGM